MVSILIKYGNVENALRSLKKRSQQEGRSKFTKKRYFESNGEKRRLKEKQSKMRRRKFANRDL